MMNTKSLHDFDYVLLNPAATPEHNFTHVAHEKLRCAGFSGMKTLLPFLIEAKSLSQDDYACLIDMAQKEQSLVCAFICSTASMADLASDISLNLEQKYGEEWHYFWYFAPKILPYVLAVINDEQQSHLFAQISEWWFFDRQWQQQWCCWRQTGECPEVRPLLLTLRQQVLLQNIPLAIKSHFSLNLARQDRGVGTASVALRARLDEVDGPLGYLAFIADMALRYPDADEAGFTQLVYDYLINPGLADQAYRSMKQQQSQNYLVYRRQLFN